MRTPLVMLAAICCGLFVTSANAQSVQISYGAVSDTNTAKVTVELLDSNITCLRIVNATSSDDKYDPIYIYVHQHIKIVTVNLLKGAGAANVFYIDAFIDDKRLDASLFSTLGSATNRVTIKMLDDSTGRLSPPGPAPSVSEPMADPPAASDPPASKPPSKGASSGGQAATGSANSQTFVPSGSKQPPKAADPPMTIRLQAPPEVSYQDTVSLRILPQNITPGVGEYVISNEFDGGTTKPVSRKILPDDKDPKFKSPQDETIDLKEGANIITVYPKIGGTEHREWGDKITIVCTECSPDRSSKSARAILGFEQIGASSAKSKMSPFLDLFFDAPLGIPYGTVKVPCDGKPTSVCTGGQMDKTVPCESGDNCRSGREPVKKHFTFSIWSSIRLQSIPVQTFVNFGTISGFQNFLTDAGTKSNELAQSFDFMIGLASPRIPFSGITKNGFFPGRTSMYFIAGAGAVNPLSVDKTAQIFKIPMVPATPPATGMVVDPDFVKVFPVEAAMANKTDIAFVTPDRDKFFRQYFAGIRLKTHFLTGGKASDMFPAMVDITIGQNEAITSTLHGAILRAEGSTPLPIKDGVLSIFGSLQMRLGRRITQDVQSLFLAPSDAGVMLFSPGTVVVPFDRYPHTISNRDIFRLGIGIDLFRLFNLQKKADTQTADAKKDNE